MKTAQTEIDLLQELIQDQKEVFKKLEAEYREKENQHFIGNCGKPIWEEKYKEFNAPPLVISKAHETETEWWDTGTISLGTRKPISIWVCKFCKIPKRMKYIATGHNHTDYSYEVCDCAGPGKPWSELH